MVRGFGGKGRVRVRGRAHLVGALEVLEDPLDGGRDGHRVVEPGRAGLDREQTRTAVTNVDNRHLSTRMDIRHGRKRA